MFVSASGVLDFPLPVNFGKPSLGAYQLTCRYSVIIIYRLTFSLQVLGRANFVPLTTAGAVLQRVCQSSRFFTPDIRDSTSYYEHHASVLNPTKVQYSP